MLKQKFLLDFGSKSIHYILQALGGIIIARFAGPNILGTIAYGTAFAGVFGFINGLLGPAHIKIKASSENEADCNTTFIILKIWSTVIFVLSVIFFYLIKKFILKIPFENSEIEWVIFISLAVVVFQNFSTIPERIFIARMQPARANIPYIFQGVFYNLGRSVFAIIGFGAIVLSSIPLIVSILLIPMYYYLLQDVPFGKYSSVLARKYLILTIPIFIIVFADSISLNAGRLILEGFTDVKMLGLFTAGNNIAGLFGLVAGTAGTMFFPLFAMAVSKNNLTTITKIINKYEKFIFNWIFPFLIFLAIFSDNILDFVLGKQYLPATSVFRILIFAAFLKILAVPFSNLLFSFNKFNISAFISISKLVIQIGLVFLLSHPNIMNLGINGLAIAILVSEVFIFSIRYYYSKKLISLNSLKSNIVYFALGFIFYSGFILLKVIVPHTYFNLILLSLLYVLSFYGIQYLFGLIKKEDFIDFLLLFNMKKLIKYINIETDIGKSDNTSP